MKKTLIALLLISSTAAPALQTPPLVIQPAVTSRVQTNFGITQIHTKAANIRIAWLPLLAPLPYALLRPTTEVPNPLVLAATQIPQRPHHESATAAVTVARR